MGVVWRARHLRLPRPMAIKVLHEYAYSQTDLLRRFRREAEVTSQLGHPHIIEVFDFNVLKDGRAYFVMELLEGSSLREQMPPQIAMDPGWAMRVLDQVAGALEHAHLAGVIHRDLKPENIFLVSQTEPIPYAKVLDFGISKIQGAKTQLTHGASLMGTPRYMSPEQASGGGAVVDGRADQFSLGAIAYELFSGRAAFNGESVTEVLLQVIQDTPVALSKLNQELPRKLEQVIMRSLSKDKEARFPSIESFRAALRAAWGASWPDININRAPVLKLTSPKDVEKYSSLETHTPARHFGTDSSRSNSRDDKFQGLEETHTRPDPAAPNFDNLSGGLEDTYTPDLAYLPLSGEDGSEKLNSNDKALEVSTQSGDGASPTRARSWLRTGGLIFFIALILSGAFIFSQSGFDSTHYLLSGTMNWLGRERVPALISSSTLSTYPSEGVTEVRTSSSVQTLWVPDEAEEAAATSTAEESPAEETETQPEVNRRLVRKPIRAKPLPIPLIGAKNALRRGAYDEAIRLARKGLRQDQDPRSYAFMTIAYCGKKDLGAANTMLRQTPLAGRLRVIARCARLGVEL